MRRRGGEAVPRGRALPGGEPGDGRKDGGGEGRAAQGDRQREGRPGGPNPGL